MSLHPFFFFFFYLYTFGHFHAKFIFSQIFIAVVKDSEKNFLRRNIRANVGRVIERRPKKKGKKAICNKAGINHRATSPLPFRPDSSKATKAWDS